ncbi:MAG: phosphonoacetaldehyde reductase [Muribaculaceae bacterium]|nr:phosphonoacetaldehyde reductase [Muribaculaceae bacterium]
MRMMTEQHIEFCQNENDFRIAFSSLIRNARKLFIVHGHQSYRSCGVKSLIDEVTSRLRMRFKEFEDFSENPKKEDVDTGVEVLLQNSPDMIVAAGGGSVMDMAKLIRYYACSKIPILAIPTTSGTGAESTQFAVCYIDGVKHSINDMSILPNHVILFPPFTYQNSRYLTACTGFDALAQAIESYWNINATEESDEYALRAIHQIYPVLGKEMLSADDRSRLMTGANDAGKAINITRTTVPHALSYTLTSKYGYPHGHAVALTFPYFLNYYLEGPESAYRGDDYEKYKAKMDLLRSILDVGSKPYSAMKEFICRLGLGFDPKRDFDDLTVAHGLNPERAGNTPLAIDDLIILSAVKSIREY